MRSDVAQVLGELAWSQVRSGLGNNFIVVWIVATLHHSQLVRDGRLIDLVRHESLGCDTRRIVEDRNTVGVFDETGDSVDFVLVRPRREGGFLVEAGSAEELAAIVVH